VSRLRLYGFHERRIRRFRLLWRLGRRQRACPVRRRAAALQSQSAHVLDEHVRREWAAVLEPLPVPLKRLSVDRPTPKVALRVPVVLTPTSAQKTPNTQDPRRIFPRAPSSEWVHYVLTLNRPCTCAWQIEASKDDDG